MISKYRRMQAQRNLNFELARVFFKLGKNCVICVDKVLIDNFLPIQVVFINKDKIKSLSYVITR